jgi:protein gp37
MYKNEFYSVDLNLGCKAGGFTKECLHCCAIRSARRNTGTGGELAKLYTLALNKEKNAFSGLIIPNPYWRNKLTGLGAIPRKYMCSYQSEIALATPEQIQELIMEVHNHPKDDFTMLSKLPLVLRKSMLIAEESFKRIGIDIKKLPNLHIATSVGEDKYKFRIDHLREFNGYDLHLFFKPFIGRVIEPNFKGISVVRFSPEKGPKARDFRQEWIDDVFKAARKFRAKLYDDRPKQDQ